MGKPRYIYIDDEINLLLDNVKNKSALVNELLREYFKKHNIKEMSIDELKELRDKHKAKLEYEAKLKEIGDGYRL